MRQQQTSLGHHCLNHSPISWCHMSKELPHREAVVSFKQAKSCATRASDKLMRQARAKHTKIRSTDNIHYTRQNIEQHKYNRPHKSHRNTN